MALSTITLHRITLNRKTLSRKKAQLNGTLQNDYRMTSSITGWHSAEWHSVKWHLVEWRRKDTQQESVTVLTLKEWSLLVLPRKVFNKLVSESVYFGHCYYHIVILVLKLGLYKRVNKTRIHPSKTTRHFCAKTIQANSTLKRLHPLYFWIQFLDLD